MFEAPRKLTTAALSKACTECRCGALPNAIPNKGVTPGGRTRSKNAAAWNRMGAVSGTRLMIAAALEKAKKEHKRVILDFGGDWCGDCQVLDIYFHQTPNQALLEKNFVLVHVWIGHFDKNVDLAAKYGVPINKGVPALAVLNADGRVVYSQGTGQFADMRHMESKSVTEFLEKWKA